MKPSHAYYADITLAWLLRLGLLLGFVVISATYLSGCSRSGQQDILPSLSSDGGKLGPPDRLSDSESNTYSKGCDEKSDSSLKRPLL